jgi:hypothetical protein
VLLSFFGWDILSRYFRLFGHDDQVAGWSFVERQLSWMGPDQLDNVQGACAPNDDILQMNLGVARVRKLRIAWRVSHSEAAVFRVRSIKAQVSGAWRCGQLAQWVKL